MNLNVEDFNGYYSVKHVMNGLFLNKSNKTHFSMVRINSMINQ